MRVLIALLMLLSTTWSSAAAARIVHPAPCAHFDEENSRARAHARLDAGNLVYAQARYLDSATGRFLSLDPVGGSLGQPISTQGFIYASANPTRFIDRHGARAKMPHEEEHLDEVLELNRELIDLAGDQSADTSRRELARRASSNVQDYVGLYESSIEGAAEGQQLVHRTSSGCDDGDVVGLPSGNAFGTDLPLSRCTSYITPAEDQRIAAGNAAWGKYVEPAIDVGVMVASIVVPEMLFGRGAAAGALAESRAAAGASRSDGVLMKLFPEGTGPRATRMRAMAARRTTVAPGGITARERGIEVGRAAKTVEEAKAGTVNRSSAYHGRLSAEREKEILASPEGVFLSTGKSRRVIFQHQGDVVITETGAQRRQVLTSYGPSGPRGESGAAALGGSPTDPGLPITEEMIVKGQIPIPGGGFVPAGVRLELPRR